MISVICQFPDGMRACERLDDRVCSGWFAVEQGLRQGCVLAPVLFNIFFAAVLSEASTHFKSDKDIMDALVHLRKKTRAGGSNCRRVSPSNAALGPALSDDVGVVSQSPEHLKKMMGVIVVVCAAFGLTIKLRSCAYARRGCRSPPPHSA